MPGRGHTHYRSQLLVLATLTVLSVATIVAVADTRARSPALVTIIIDDLGNSLARGRRVIALPAPIAVAILPHTAYSARLATEAHRAHKDVLLHLPMQPLNDAEPGPGVIEVNMPARELAITLDYDLRTVPHAVGVNNHMGSRMTQDEPAMRRLLEALRVRGNLFFVDSRTGPTSAIARIGQSLGVPILTRDVFLDHEIDSAAIRARLDQLVAIARRRGHAIGIGHPHPKTLATLEAWLPTTPSQNVRIAPLSELVTIIDQRERRQ